MVSVGCSGAMNFVVSHELLHSPAKEDKRVASLALMPVAYSHWVVSHLAHHRKVHLAQLPPCLKNKLAAWPSLSDDVTDHRA